MDRDACSSADVRAASPARPTPRRRRRATDPRNHHLWRNGRRWWIAFTVHTPDGRGMRIRRSLGTTDVHEARRRRDDIFARARNSPELLLVER